MNLLDEIETNHIALVGKHGVGKTYRAKNLKRELEIRGETCIYFHMSKPPKQILQKLLKEIKPGAKEVALSDILDQIVKNIDKRIYIILDEFHLASSIAVSYYRLLIERTDKVRFICIVTSNYLKKLERPEFKRFSWHLKQIEIFPLTFEESKALLQEHGTTENINYIARKCNGIPLALLNYSEEVSNGVVNDSAVNLFPIFSLSVFFFIALKYLLRNSDYELSNLFGFLGVFFMLVLRYFRYGK